MEIGPLKRVIEVEPTSLPVPEMLPEAEPLPEREPVPVEPEPNRREPEPSEP